MSSGRNPIISCPGGRSPPATPTQYYTQKRFRKGAHLVFRTETRRAAAGLDNTMARLPLTGPVILAELGWMAMGIVDTLFVGRLGAEAIGAVSLRSALYFSIAIFGIGLLLGLDTLVSQAYGAGRRDECHGWLVQALYLCLALSPPVMLLLSGGIPWLGRLGVHPAVMAQAVPFLRALTWGTFPLFLYAAFRRYLQGIG